MLNTDLGDRSQTSTIRSETHATGVGVGRRTWVGQRSATRLEVECWMESSSGEALSREASRLKADDVWRGSSHTRPFL